MKKISRSFITGLIAIWFSLGVTAQSSQQDLNQVELMKQFIGTWKTETGVDTTALWEVIPSDKGYLTNIYWQSKGVTYSTGKGIIGFTGKNKLPNQIVNFVFLWPNGFISYDMGKFDSDKKISFERFNADHSHIPALWEMNFQTKDKITEIYKFRGSKDTWDDAKVTEYTFTRVKK
jgi:hypothetical protein